MLFQCVSKNTPKWKMPKPSSKLNVVIFRNEAKHQGYINQCFKISCTVSKTHWLVILKTDTWIRDRQFHFGSKNQFRSLSASTVVQFLSSYFLRHWCHFLLPYKTRVKLGVPQTLSNNAQSEPSYFSLSVLLYKLLQKGEKFEIVLFALGHFV